MADDGEQIQLVQVRGELDLVTVDTLVACGYAAIGRPARVLLLDLTGVLLRRAWAQGAGPDRQSRRPKPAAGMVSSRRSHGW